MLAVADEVERPNLPKMDDRRDMLDSDLFVEKEWYSRIPQAHNKVLFDLITQVNDRLAFIDIGEEYHQHGKVNIASIVGGKEASL